MFKWNMLGYFHFGWLTEGRGVELGLISQINQRKGHSLSTDLPLFACFFFILLPSSKNWFLPCRCAWVLQDALRGFRLIKLFGRLCQALTTASHPCILYFVPVTVRLGYLISAHTKHLQHSSHCWVKGSSQLCLTPCSSMNCSPPSSSANRIFQARTLERVAFSSCRGSSQPRDQTVSPMLVGGFFTHLGSP